MSMANQFINDVKLDEMKRIIISVNPNYQSYLQNDKVKQSLKKAALDTLKTNFIKLEVGKTGCRITVKEGTEEKSLEQVNKELIKGIEMAMNFLNRK
ncbi:MAG: hypothetical protein K0Q49_2398 [Haloplasmataceae bacterium]|jgi:hypothetical protein|nr:hypothetical protein [Haloplasmataceae bacterium]